MEIHAVDHISEVLQLALTSDYKKKKFKPIVKSNSGDKKDDSSSKK